MTGHVTIRGEGYLVMRIDMIHRCGPCTGFVKLLCKHATLSIGSADSLAHAGGRSHDA